ncbi:MAG: IS66 family insertion sequence element accessory protein TnpB [Hyphomicrobiales bacterium]|nr:IS66 family insertion sequence element accessory protein TnpB [Hyphomicrobiales bacterium]
MIKPSGSRESDERMHYETCCGDLIKVIWFDGQGACLFSKRLEKGRFVWPSPADGKVSVTSAQLAMLLEGIDWRMPQRTWKPLTAGNLTTNPAL